MIGLEVVAEQRQPEAALALERAVTGPAVAAQPAQQRHDVPLESRDFLRVRLGEALEQPMAARPWPTPRQVPE